VAGRWGRQCSLGLQRDVVRGVVEARGRARTSGLLLLDHHRVGEGKVRTSCEAVRGSHPPSSLASRSSRSSDKLTTPWRGSLAAESSLAASSAGHGPLCKQIELRDPREDSEMSCVALLSPSPFAWHSRGTPRSQPQTPRWRERPPSIFQLAMRPSRLPLSSSTGGDEPMELVGSVTRVRRSGSVVTPPLSSRILMRTYSRDVPEICPKVCPRPL